MHSHVSLVAQTCFYYLHRIRAVRRQLGRDVTARLFTALVLSLLDYCNAVLVGLPVSKLAPFQRVLHAAARTVLNLKPRDRVTPALQDLHWLPVAERMSTSCACWFTSRFWHTCLEYIPDLLMPVAKIPGRPALRTSSRGDLVVPRTRRRIGDRALSVVITRPADGHWHSAEPLRHRCCQYFGDLALQRSNPECQKISSSFARIGFALIRPQMKRHLMQLAMCLREFVRGNVRE